jgi:tripartite-type tricarboxylate transporter receptor subunit TctC
MIRAFRRPAACRFAAFRRGNLRLAVLPAAVALAIGSAAAQEWPTRTIRMVVPLSAGSAVDIVPRIVMEQVSTQIGQSIVVDNRTGASGTIGTRAVATAAPDRYTLLTHSSALVISPLTIANAHYDAVKDFVAIAPLGNLPNVLVIAPSKNIHTAQELVAAARKRPVTFGLAGFGSPIFLTTEKFRLAANFSAQPIPFRGAPEVLTEVMTGRVDFYYAPVTAALGFIRDGKLTALTVSSAQRSLALPDVPTSLEAGYPNSDFNFWIGVFAPAGTPAAIVEKLNREIGKGAAGSRGAREARRAGRRPHGIGHCRIRPLHQGRGRLHDGTRQGARPQAELNPMKRSVARASEATPGTPRISCGLRRPTRGVTRRGRPARGARGALAPRSTASRSAAPRGA